MIKGIPILIAYSITSIIIIFLDKKFYIINKVNFRLDKKIKVTKKPQFYIIFALMLLFILGIVGIYIIDFADIYFRILSGMIIAIGCMFSTLTRKTKL